MKSEENEYYEYLFKLKKFGKKYYLREERLLFDLVGKRFWCKVKDTPTAQLNIRVVNGETWIEYDYAMDLIVAEFKEECGHDIHDIEEAEIDIPEEDDPWLIPVSRLNRNAEMINRIDKIRSKKND